MTPSQQAPSLVERLTTNIRLPDEDGTAWMERRLAERKEAAARITELEGENEQLRLAICGGEDAPGYAASLPLATILDVQAESHRSASDYIELAYDGEGSTWKARAEATEARCARLEPLLREAALLFRFYEQSHLAKKTQEGDEKAHRNAEIAGRIEAALEQTKGGESA